MATGRTNGAREAARAGHRAWLDNWRRVGQVLEAERWQRLLAMSEAEAQQAVQDVLDLWQPDWTGDDGEGLMRLSALFRQAARPDRTR